MNGLDAANVQVPEKLQLNGIHIGQMVPNLLYDGCHQNKDFL
jgi:hypothetical protein